MSESKPSHHPDLRADIAVVINGISQSDTNGAVYKMNTTSITSDAEGTEFNSKLKKANLEAGFYNIVDGKRSSLGGTLAVLDPSTRRHLAAVPDIDREGLELAVSAARILKVACDGISGEVELRPQRKFADDRLRALAAAVNAERVGGFPSGRLFLDSVEQALAGATVVVGDDTVLV